MRCEHCEDLERRVAELEDAMVEMAADHEDLVEEVAEMCFDLECLHDEEDEEDEVEVGRGVQFYVKDEE